VTDIDIISKLRLARTENVGPVTWRRLLSSHGTAQNALAALPEIARKAGRATSIRIPSEKTAEQEIAAVKKAGGKMLFLGDAQYPSLLALLSDAPPVLTILGDFAAFLPRGVGVVGARNASSNGQRMARALAEELAAQDITIVSGLARGIDAAAHEGALVTGLTIAAIAGGIDQPYPEENAALQARIAQKGCVVTEAPFGTAPQARHFPRRNRIIAGLSLGVVVVEAALRSGSLITVELAQDAGREIFAVPGSPLDPRCRGTNDLIKAGAYLTETAADVLANLPDHPGAIGSWQGRMFAPGCAEAQEEFLAPPIDFIRARRQVREALGHTPAAIDEIVRGVKLPVGVVMSALVDMEIAGEAELLPGNQAVLLG
jgi:DNA processing protein